MKKLLQNQKRLKPLRGSWGAINRIKQEATSTERHEAHKNVKIVTSKETAVRTETCCEQ